MKAFWLTFTPLALVLFLVTGCGSAPKLGDVTATLIDIRPVSATPLETEAEVTLRYANGNVFALALSGSRHKLYLNETYIGNVLSNEPIGIPQLSTATQKATLHIENLAFVQKLAEIASSKSAAYRLDSVLHLEVSENRMRIKSSSSGQLDLAALLGGSRP